MSDPGEIHARSIVIDGLTSFKRPDGEFFESLKAAGLTAFSQTLSVLDDFRDSVKRVYKFKQLLRQWPNLVTLVTSAADIEAAKRDGKVGVILNFQNTVALEDEELFVEALYDMGVRVLQLTYNERNLVGDGCTERVQSGLSDFGVQVVEECNRVGMLVDLSHVGEATCLDAVEVCRGPLVISHSNPKALCDVPRNVNDDLILRVARKGGLVGINAFPGFLRKDGQRPTLEDFVANVRYVAKLAGIEHVAVGTDLIDRATLADYTTESGAIGVGKKVYKPGAYPPWPWQYPTGLEKATEYPNLTAALVKAGFAPSDIRKILGENWLRVYRAVWR